jgi:protein O-mannosyl-transferase
MDGKEPSLGYSYLGYLLSETRFNIAITTNFDNLIADAISIYGRKFPLVLADDSVANYATSELRRALIAKIHGGIGFRPKNSTDEIATLSPEWSSALTAIFNRCEPIVIGYAGNDGSLMNFLNAFEKSDFTLHWCLRCKPSEIKGEIKRLPGRVQNLANKHRIRFIPIESFDQFFLALHGAMAESNPAEFPDLLKRLKEKHKQREDEHEKQRSDLVDKPIMPAPSKIAIVREARAEQEPADDESMVVLLKTESARRDKKPWWEYQNEANTSKSFEEKKVKYLEGIAAHPQSSQLLLNYAIFLTKNGQYYQEADDLFKRAIDIDPKDANNLGSYALFLTEILKRHDQAEVFFMRAIETYPKHANNLGNYANFLTDVRQRHDEAERLYKLAIEADPKDAYRLQSYGYFLAHVRQHDDEAEVLYQRAIETDPKDANTLGSYACFLTDVRHRHDEAEEFFKRAVEIEPKNAEVLGSYASFLTDVRHRHDEAEDFYKRAIDADSKNAINLGSYGTFLINIRQRRNEADALFTRAIEADPKDAVILGNYAKLLFETGRVDAGLDFCRRAEAGHGCTNGLRAELAFYRYAMDANGRGAALAALKDLVPKKARSPGWKLGDLIAHAAALGHPNLPLLHALNDFITRDGSEDALQAFQEWQEA